MINAALIGTGWWGRTLVESMQPPGDHLRFVGAASCAINS